MLDWALLVFVLGGGGHCTPRFFRISGLGLFGGWRQPLSQLSLVLVFGAARLGGRGLARVAISCWRQIKNSRASN